MLKAPILKDCERVLVVSNNQQNDMSEYLVVVPLERRASRLKAPFAVDFGRSEGLRDLHTARCDWISCIKQDDIGSIERAKVREDVMQRVDQALGAALSLTQGLVTKKTLPGVSDEH